MSWNPDLHPRVPGGEHGGEFAEAPWSLHLVRRLGFDRDRKEHYRQWKHDPKNVKASLDFHDPVTGISAEAFSIRGRYHDSTTADVRLMSSDGRQVGNATFKFDHEKGDVHIHEIHIWSAQHQGQGFWTRWAQQLEPAWKAAGADHITLVANVDVGGYSWARDGYDFVDDSERAAVVRRAQETLYAFNPGTQAQVKAVMDRPDFTPIEMAMVGWQPGLSTWPGKQIMKPAFWKGFKRL